LGGVGWGGKWWLTPFTLTPFTLDHKGDIKDKQDEKNRVLAGVMSRNIAQEIIGELDIDIEIRHELIRLLKEIDMDIASAQIFEVNTGIFSNIERFNNEEEYLDIYFDRCRKNKGV